MSTALKSLGNKDLAGKLRETVNDLSRADSSGFPINQLEEIEEASRRLEFGYTPPEQPPEKSALELKREQEKHDAFMAVANRLKSAGLGGHGIFVFDQLTGDAYIFTSHKTMIEYVTKHPGPRTDYRTLSLIDDVGRKFDICHNGDYGKKSFPAPIEENP